MNAASLLMRERFLQFMPTPSLTQQPISGPRSSPLAPSMSGLVASGLSTKGGPAAKSSPKPKNGLKPKSVPSTKVVKGGLSAKGGSSTKIIGGTKSLSVNGLRAATQK
ncbi:hypothetical protein AHAS_Ahas01G0299500 [Arachis hypogaea]